MQNKYQLSVSINCINLLTLKNDIQQLEKMGVDYIHFDVMDGVFVPRFGLYPEMLKSIREVTRIPIEIHMMILNPEPYIETFIEAGADRIIIHPEPLYQLHRVITRIKNLKKKVGLAINPATSLNVLYYLLDMLDCITIMGINPGIIGHKFIPIIYQKISDCRKICAQRLIEIEVDGGVTFQNAFQIISSGADVLVGGSATIFNKDASISKNITRLRSVIYNSPQ